MKKMSKTLSVFLAILMVISIIPITASAEENAVSYDYTVISEVAKTCRLNSDDGISRAESDVLEIPSEIDGYKVIELSDDFDYDSNTNKIVVPDSVEKIGGAFNSKNGLFTIVLGAGVSDFEAKNFNNMDNLKEFIVSKDNPYICSVDGVVFTKDMKTLLRFPTDSKYDTVYKIPDGVEIIGKRAFVQGWNLKYVKIPDSVITIDEQAFSGCEILERVDMGKGVATIGFYAFANCVKLANVYYAGTEEDWAKISINSKGNNNLINAYIHFDENAGHTHTFEFVKTVAPTCGEDGYTLYFCTGCEEYFDRDYVDATGIHDYNQIITTNPTCTKQGYTTYTCNCGEYYIDNYVDALGHNYEEAETSPDETECVKVYKCSNCDDSYTVNGHTKVITPAKVPTTTETGNTRDERCSSCGKVFIEGQIIPALNEDSFAKLQGDNLIGVLDTEARTLTIYGTGIIKAEYDFTSIYDKDWGMNIGYTSFVDTLIITGVITEIGNGAFKGYPMDSVVIPESVKIIGADAFGDCYCLTTVYYTGTEEQWQGISIGISNEPLLNATIHYNYGKSFTGIKGDYFYINGVRQKAYQLIEFDGNFYFINDYNKIAKNKRIYLSQRFVDGFTYEDGTPLAVGYYEFDADGKMIIRNGVVGDYFYKNNVRQNAYQLVEFDGDFYFINDSHKLAKNKTLYLSDRFVNGFTYEDGTPLQPGYYTFDENGKMIILNGPVGDYFYENNVRLKAYQLVEFEGEIYFVYDSHKLAKNKKLYLSQRFVEGTDLEVGYYDFDADGKMIIG